ncbi:DNA helicase [Rhizocola hellebori]|uniref:DNA helicase n=1 Tax=Rhizocola hellebori TaxID=1392758 RepID=A0A8J3Q3P4_9ACTN|nr:UvrD-helicase domain-containing protein [Rhizocola hellebori]GIH03164.1 DNA helicase [Rhizocola hellebori]
MDPKSAEIAREQEYFDRAEKHREQKRQGGSLAGQAGVHPAAAAALIREARQRAEQVGGADDAVAIGRIDDQEGAALYIGKHLILDEESEPLVISWKAPAAEPYYLASHADARNVARKRTFACSGNHIDDFTDVIFASIAAAVAGPDSELLRDLNRGRTGSLRDIVATIQAAQFELIRAPLEQVLVIEGGPGTGKTVIALHRVSWLLYQHRERLQAREVLVVGPNPTFARYITSVLPSLGDTEVAQVDITKLAPEVALGWRDEPDAVRLKGDPRMVGLLARALDGRVGVPEPAERLLVDGRFVTLPGPEVEAAVTAARRLDMPYTQRRLALRDSLVQMLADRGLAAPAGVVENLLSRLWPVMTPGAFLRDLLGSKERLFAAGGAEFTTEELLSLRRRAADRLSEQVWSRHDLPLLDEAEQLINGSPQRYAHIVVDEVQDLSPMQLRSIARRSSTGSLTIVGDLSQSTGAWARDSWAEVAEHLPAKLEHHVVNLRYGYRVPKQIFDHAAPLHRVAAPEAVAPEAVREGPQGPRIHRAEEADRAGRVATMAAVHAAEGRFVGIICAAPQRGEVEEALAANGSSWSSADRGELGRAINLVSPQEAKGLEFDAVIVVEPEAIVASDPRGLRLLYVALTRTTGYLDVIAVGDPLPLKASEPSRKALAMPGAPLPSSVAGPAAQVAILVRNSTANERWAEVLREAARLLERPE